MIIELFHGTRAAFKKFDPQYFRSGEGVGSYNGWYFCKTLKGALAHCDSFLGCDVFSGEGIILRCEIADCYVDVDIDAEYTDPIYGRPVFGVALEKSIEIQVIESIPARSAFESIYGAIII